MSHPALGKEYSPFEYEVGREKIREYSLAIGATNPVYFDRERATAEGFRDVVAPPMFAVVYSAPSLGASLLDPELGIDLALLLHGAQEFVWDEPVCSGDVLTTVTTFKDHVQEEGHALFVFESVSKNQAGQATVRGTWTNLVRGG